MALLHILTSKYLAPFKRNPPSSSFKKTLFYVREHALLEA